MSWQTTDPWGDLLAEHDPLTGTGRDALLGYLGTLEAWADEQGVDYVARDSFGNPALPSADIEPHALTWHAQDPNGLIYAGARYLDPGTGRFISQDPAAAGNLYHYAMNDPINAWDPYGATAVVEDGHLRKATGTATAGGARKVGIKLVCTFTEVAAIAELTGPEAVAIDVIGIACTAVGSRKPGRPPRPGCPTRLCMTSDAKVAVPEGMRSIAEMEVGDRVISDEPASDGDLEWVSEGEGSKPVRDEGEWLYEPRSGDWVPLTRPLEVGDEVLRDGRLIRVTEKGPVEIGRASLRALQASDATWEEAPRHDTPSLESWVLVLDEELHHARLGDVEPGSTVAYQGRVLRMVGTEAVQAVLPTGQVLARIVRTFSRVAPEVIDATIQFEDGTTEVLTATPEHPLHLAEGERYAPLRELHEGVRLTTDDGLTAVVLSVEPRFGKFTVYNFEVAGQHNYFAGDVLAHNPPSPAICKKLGGLLPQADECVRDVLKQRGGGGTVADRIGDPWIGMTLLEVAKAAVQGNADAETAIKLVKQARRLQQKCKRR